MKNLMFVIMAATVLLLAGCSSITSGDVCEKDFVPAHDEIAFVPDGTFEGNFTTDTDHIPDRWYITFRKADEKNGGWRTRKVQVEEDTFKNTQLGDHFSLEP